MKDRIFLIFSIFYTVFSYGQVTLISAVEDKDYRVNQKITLTFVLKVEGNDFVQESPLMLPDLSKFNVIGNASDQNSYVDPEKKIVINQLVYQYVVSPKIAGKIRIGSALVDVNGHRYKTEPMDILVKDADKKAENSAADTYLSLEVDKKEVYENQPVKAVLRLFSKDIDNFRRVENVQAPSAASFQVQPLSLAKSEIEPVAERPNWSSQVLAVYLIIPGEAGNGVIPRFSANIKHADNAVRVSTPAVRISVKKFPKSAPPDYKKTVGSHFALSLSGDDGDGDAEENSYQIDKPFNVTLKFSGDGSFSEASVPKLRASADYIFYPPTIENQTKFSAIGRSGTILVHYVIVPKTAGKITVSTENFSFFNPATKKFTALTPAILAVNVFTPQQFEDSKTAIQKVTGYTNSIMNTVKLPAMQSKNVKQNRSQNWLLPLMTGIAGLFAALFFWIRKKKKGATNPQELLHDTHITKHNEIFDFKELQDAVELGDFSKFFTAFDRLQQVADAHAQGNGFKNISDFAESARGNRVSENLRALFSKVQVERFAPVHSQAFMRQLLDEVKAVFSELQNNR